jgi:thiamine-monophosphate kinase
MKTGELGERAFLASIKDYITMVKGARLGFDEDASDFPLTDDKHIVVNVDTFVRETDWLRGMSAAQAGRKTAVMALSDLAAKGAKPVCTMLSLCVPEDYDSQEASELVRGFSQYGLKAGIPCIGGDTGMASDVILTGIALGVASSNGIITRRGAKVGDVIVVTGLFGLTSVAYEMLLRGRLADDSLQKNALLAAYKPQINLEIVSALASQGAITSSMDSSDGLGITLHTMAGHSRVRFVIDQLPIASGVKAFAQSQSLDEMSLVMQGGEEFLLALTIPESRYGEAAKIAEANHASLIKIGHVQRGRGVVYETPQGVLDIPSSGYDNFKEWQ